MGANKDGFETQVDVTFKNICVRWEKRTMKWRYITFIWIIHPGTSRLMHLHSTRILINSLAVSLSQLLVLRYHINAWLNENRSYDSIILDINFQLKCLNKFSQVCKLICRRRRLAHNPGAIAVGYSSARRCCVFMAARETSHVKRYIV